MAKSQKGSGRPGPVRPWSNGAGTFGGTIGVIGCGNMGQALIKGMLASRLVSPRQLVTWHPRKERLAGVVRRFRIRAARSNAEVAASDVVILAVKPQKVSEVLKEIRSSISHRPLLISIAAGIPMRWIQRKIGASVPLVRVMPNIPALARAGISAVAKGRFARAKELKVAERIFGCVGRVVHIPEAWMDVVTAVSGSGPAYFFFLMEEMIKAGIQMGLSPQVARELVLQTALGAAQLARDSGEEPGVLRLRVTSRGGTTEAAFRVFLRRRLGWILQQGIRAAAQRARELKR